MKSKAALLFAMILPVALESAQVTAAENSSIQSTRYLLSGCEFGLTFPAGTIAAKATQMDLLYRAGICFGTVATISAIIRGGSSQGLICIPDDADLNRSVAVAVEWARKRPDQWDEPLAQLAQESFAEAWPCRK